MAAAPFPVYCSPMRYVVKCYYVLSERFMKGGHYATHGKKVERIARAQKGISGAASERANPAGNLVHHATGNQQSALLPNEARGVSRTHYLKRRWLNRDVPNAHLDVGRLWRSASRKQCVVAENHLGQIRTSSPISGWSEPTDIRSCSSEIRFLGRAGDIVARGHHTARFLY